MQLRKNISIFFLFVLLLFMASQPAQANCWARYDEAYRSFFQSSMGHALPARAGNFASMAECQSYLAQVLSDPVYSGDAGLQRTTCECDASSGISGGAYAVTGGTFQEQLTAGLVTSLFNGLLSGSNSNTGPTAQELQEQAQKKWTHEEIVRHEAELQRGKQVFAQAQQDSVALLGNRPGLDLSVVPDPQVTDSGAVYIGNGRIPSLLRKSDVVQESEWHAVGQGQARIDQLLAKKERTPKEIEELAALEAQRNTLWKRAVAVPGLSQEDRNALQLKLPVLEEGAVIANSQDLMDLHEQKSEQLPPKSILTTMTEASVTFGVQTAVETWGEDAAEALTEKDNVLKFGDALLIGQGIKASVEGKPEEMGEATSSWVYGKLAKVMPGAALSVGTAQGVAAVTTATFRRSWAAVLTETDKIIPGFLPADGAEGWWKEMKEEQTTAQKFCMNYWGL